MESLLLSGKRRSLIGWIDIDFSDAALNSSDVVDKAGNSWVYSGTTKPKVVDDPTEGRVMEFNGTGWFDASRPSFIDLVQNSFQITAKIKHPAGRLVCLFGTGDYGSNRILGVSFSLNQYAAYYAQLFIDNGSYARLLANATNNADWATITMRRRKGVDWYIKVERNGVLIGESTMGDFAPGPGTTFMRLGNSIVGGDYQLAGRLKSFKLEKI